MAMVERLTTLTFLLYASFAAAMLLIPYVLITSGGYSPVQAGLAMLPLPILMTSISPFMGSLAMRIGPRVPLTVGPLVVAGGMLLSRLMDHVLAARGERRTIVVATSGDTGGAAAEAFRDRDHVDLIVLFPDGRISDVQRRMITTVGAANVPRICALVP